METGCRAVPGLTLGIDFSGDAGKWRPYCRRSNVWIAAVENGVLRRLCRVQELPGTDPPFERLGRWLRETPFAAAGIDAPFSLPAAFVPGGSHGALLALVSALSLNGRPFPRGSDLVAALRGAGKPLRETESFWAHQGVNVRSTLWNGARGGAPMTAACLTLLAGAGLPLWPWETKPEGLLAEAFPAAQLKAWSLPHHGYNHPKPGAAEVRTAILDGIKTRTGLRVTRAFEAAALAGADALDAILCAFAAEAVAAGALFTAPEPIAASEGWIAVHR